MDPARTTPRWRPSRPTPSSLSLMKPGMVEDLPLAVLVATIFFSDATGDGGGGGELVIPSYRISKSICGVELYASSNVKARGSISTLVPILGTLDDVVVVVVDDADGFFVFFRDGGRAATAASRYDTMPSGTRDDRPRPCPPPRGEGRSPSSAATSTRRDDGGAADDNDDDDDDDGEKASADEEQLARIVAAAAAARAMPLRRLRRHCIGSPVPAAPPSIVNNDGLLSAGMVRAGFDRADIPAADVCFRFGIWTGLSR